MASTSTLRTTPLVRLLDAAVTRTTGVSLPTYLAMHRAPGVEWKTYQELADEVTRMSGYPVNRVTLQNFGENTYAIPDSRYTTVNGRRITMPRPVDADAIADYITALDTDHIDTSKVADHAGAALGRQLAAQAETDAILADPDTMQAIADGEADLTGGGE